MVAPIYSQEDAPTSPQKPAHLYRNTLLLHGKRVPLMSGEVQFFRMSPDTWKDSLLAVKKLGLPMVSTYLSWRRFATGVNKYDLNGKTDPHLNLPKFLDLCRELELWVTLKPGPWICAEETNGGYPDWLVADPDLQVLDCHDHPVMGYNPPFQSPIPSYLHPKYQEYVRVWLEEVDRVILPYAYPNGPIVLVQLDNEPGFTFHDRMFESDYNPSIAGENGLYAQWLEKKYSINESIPAIYAQECQDIRNVRPPRELQITKLEELPRYWDWVEFKEWLLAAHVQAIGEYHRNNGLTQVLFTTNYNDHPQLATPNDWQRLESSGDIGGFDYYPHLPMQFSDFVKTILAVNYSRCVNRVAWSPEIMCGVWTFEGQPHTSSDFQASDFEYLYLTCMAYGLKGMNFYMLADRDNWVGSPLDTHGKITPASQAVENTIQLMNSIPHFYDLDQEQPVGVVFYRPYAREAFTANETPKNLEGYQLGSTYSGFDQVYKELVSLNINPGVVDLWVKPQTLRNYRMVFLSTGSYMDRNAQQALVDYVNSGGILVVFPALPNKDLNFQPLPLLEALAQQRTNATSNGVSTNNKGALIVSTPPNMQLSKLLEQHGITPEVKATKPEIITLLHHGTNEEVLFVINPTNLPVATELHFRSNTGGQLAEVLKPNAVYAIENGESRLEISPRTVRVFLIRYDASKSRAEHIAESQNIKSLQ